MTTTAELPKSLRNITGLRLRDGRYRLSWYVGGQKARGHRQLTLGARLPPEEVKRLCLAAKEEAAEGEDVRKRAAILKDLEPLFLAGAFGELCARLDSLAGKTVQSKPFAELVELYLEGAGREMHEGGLTRNRQIAKSHLEPFFEGRAGASIRRADVRRYRTKREKDGVKSGTIRRELVVLNAILNFAQDELEAEGFANPLRGGRQRKKRGVAAGDERKSEPLTPAEWRRLLAAFEPEAWKQHLEKQREKVRTMELDGRKVSLGTGGRKPDGDAAAKVIEARRAFLPLLEAYMLTGGSRLGELLELRWRDVDLKLGTVRVHMPKVDRAKLVPIVPKLEAILRAIGRGTPDALVFVRQDGRPFGKMDVTRAFERAVEIAGLALDDQGAPRKVTPHSIRHTVIRWLRAAGYSEGVQASLVGHSPRSVTESYGGALSPDELRPVVEHLVTIAERGFTEAQAKTFAAARHAEEK